ncbi:MAG: RepB family protein [Candidatus Pacearchaeota archaeon]
MAIKTFNIDKEAYDNFSAYCKKNGISMSKRVEHFIKEEVAKLKDKIPSAKKVVATVAEGKKVLAQHHSFSRYC